MPALNVTHLSLAPAELPPVRPGSDLLAALGIPHGSDGTLHWLDSQPLCERLLAHNTGDRRWRGFKQAQLEDVLELSRQSDRVRVVGGNLQGDFNLLVHVHTPVPLCPHEGRLRIGDHVILHVAYQSAWLTDPPHPQAPVRVFSPSCVFLPNAAPHEQATLCLGMLPAGVPVVELVHLAYLAVSVQTVMLNEIEGVLNPVASDWFREHPQHWPLTRTGLLEPWSADELTLHNARLESEGGAT